jgi:hypothetical protein
VDASGTVTSWERVGELASQLTTCAADLEQFLVQEMDQMQALQRTLEGQVSAARCYFHPGSGDPVIAAVLKRFQQLESETAEGEGVTR